MGMGSEVEELERAVMGLEALVKRVRSYARELRTRARKLRRRMERRGYWIDYTYVQGHGPYYRLRWMENGEIKCKYLGKSPKLPKELENNKEAMKIMDELASLDNEAERLKRIVERAEKTLQEAFNKAS